MRHLLLALLGLRCSAAGFDVAVTVVDESGVPLAGAPVPAETVPRLARDSWNAPARRVRVESTADARGVARLAGEHALPELTVSAALPGFHPAARRMGIRAPAVRLVLPRRFGAPVEASQVDVLTRALPGDGAEHGFDLVLAAWIAPLGVGRQADVWISGRCGSARLAVGAGGAYVDEALMRFDRPGDGVVATPRPGQPGFAASVSPVCDGQLLPGLSAPRRAPSEGYVDQLSYRSARGSAPGDVPGPGRAGAPQWIFRVTRDGAAVHGVITDFGWTEDGSLRLTYRLSGVPGDPSLDFTP